MKCIQCEKEEMIPKKVEYIQFGRSFGKFDALFCSRCGETLFESSASEQIQKKAKELGVWGLAKKVRIGTSGSSLDVKLPKAIAEFLKLKKGQEVIIEPKERNKLEITLV